jgi:outer membrane immunogenic protein
MKKFLLATVSMVALTSVSRAADMPAAMPAKAPIYMPAPVADWTGLYLGVQGGVVRRDALSEIGTNGFERDGSKTGGIAGAVLGYNWQHGGFVYGLEGDWSWIGAKAEDIRPGTFSNSYDVNWLATIRGRAGLALDTTILYLTGGAAFGHAKDSFAFLFSNGSVAVSYAQDQTKAGWAVGAGVEHMFTPNWTARAEVRYVDLGRTSVACTPAASCSETAKFSNTLTMGLIGLNYKFGSGRTADWSQAHAYAPPSVPAWAGGYLGIQGGVASQHAFFDDSDCFFTNDCRHFDRVKTGGTAGGLAGYNWQQGSFVYGVEGDWSWLGAKAGDNAIVNGGNESLSISFDLNWLATLRGRAGLAFDATLFYVTGGLALGHVKNSVTSTSASFTQNQTKVGWTAGLGVEHMLSQHWTARAEFRYVDLGKTNVACSSATDFNDCVGFGYRGDFSNTLMMGLVGLNYRF